MSGDTSIDLAQSTSRARTYVTVIQAAEGYPADSELRALEETPAPPVVHAVVLLDDHEKLEAERDFLLERAARFNRDVGLSSCAMVMAAITGEEPSDHPHDASDLGRCERTYAAAPEHLKAAMLPLLERWRAALEGGPDAR